jgi:YD repeat-containing protein
MLANWGESTVVVRSRRAPRPALVFTLPIALTALALTHSLAFAQSVTATHTYDDAGRLKRSTYSDGKSVSYEYDAAGNRKSTAEGTPVQLSIAAASATEGGTLNFVVTKSGTATGTVSATCVQVNGTATGGSDFTVAQQVLTFQISDTTKTCSVVSLQDAVYESEHTFSAILQDPVGAVQLTGGSAIGTILDNDPAPTFSVSGGSVTEGTAIPFTITKSGATELNHGVNYATANGTATIADADYSTVSSVRTFGPSVTTFVLQVPTTTDPKYESNETVLLNLSDPTNGATIATGQATGTMTNNDVAPSFSVNDPAAVVEGNAITFTVTKGGNTSTAMSHSFNWATANGTAVAPSDYTTANGTVTFAAADMQKTFQVQTVTDGVADSAHLETLLVNLTTNVNTNEATLSDSQGTGLVGDLQGIPAVPQNIRKVPESGFSQSYTILWDASTGTVNHYTLEEVQVAPGSGTTTYSVSTTSKSFNKGNVYLELEYRVRACATANESQCSGYSGVVFKMVCPTTGCP